MILRQIICILFFAVLALRSFGIDVERFERLDTRNGLSQNIVQSIFCDHKGYLWAGTMDGLNRFDGHNFKIFRSDPGKENTLTQNRVIQIFEDERNFLWLQTNDRYFHYFIRETEEFISFPSYSKTVLETTSFVTSFHQYNRDQIWIGSSKSGLYQLQFDSLHNRYQSRQFLSPVQNGQSFGRIHFIISSKSGDLFVGTDQSLYLVSSQSISGGDPTFTLIATGHSFVSGAITDHFLWVGTRDQGIFKFPLQNKGALVQENELLSIKQVTFLKMTRDGSLMCIGTFNEGFFLYHLQTKKIKWYSTERYEAQIIYEDRSGTIWMKSRRAGITRIKRTSLDAKYFKLVPPGSNPLVDDEETLFFEDSKDNFWIANQGTGLGWYCRDGDSIQFFRYDQTKPGTISSNFILCMTEDQTGTLWVGTAQTNGGLNKIIMANPSFRHFVPTNIYKNESENLVRSLFSDCNGYMWAGTKGAAIHLYKPDLKEEVVYKDFDKKQGEISGFNSYSIMQDRKGFIWIGTKGGGVSVSDQPVGEDVTVYSRLKFINYRFSEADPNSLSSNMVYSIKEDHLGQIWIGTFNGGINRVIERSPARMVCQRYSELNSNLSTKFVRNLMVDKDHNLWVATNFGLNVAPIHQNGEISPFVKMLYDPDDKEGLGYNDVVHLFQDSRGWIWCATFGGGINLVEKYQSGSRPIFQRFTSREGLINDAVYAIEEDSMGNMWFSTEKGISKLEIPSFKFENFGMNSGIVHENFNENSSAITQSGKLLFGNLKGFVSIDPSDITINQFVPKVVLVRFMVNNREIDFREPGSPLKEPIGEAEGIVLNPEQTNFSIEFSSLDFKAPESVRYQYRLDPFDEGWCEPGYQRIATYTNLNHGQYLFRVRSTNSDGVWSAEETQVEITIKPPFWKTGWFKSMVIIALLLALFLIQRQREVTYKRQRTVLEQKVEERTQEILAQKEKIEIQNSKLDEANRLKDRFFNIIAHDLKSPVIAFYQLSEQLIEDYSRLKETERLKFIVFINKSAQNVMVLVEELLMWARAQSNKVEYQYKRHDLNLFVQQTIESLELLARNKDVELVNRFTDSVMAYCDEMTIMTVLRNLVANAIKFSNPGSCVELGYKTDGNFIKVFVKDYGVGISKELGKKLFRIDEKITSKGTAGEQGTGLGLYICYEFVKGNGGSIEFESEKGKGSVFWFSLPANEGVFLTENTEH